MAYACRHVRRKTLVPVRRRRAAQADAVRHQHACSPSQWNRLRPIVERNCTPAIWAELSSKFGLNGDGPIV